MPASRPVLNQLKIVVRDMDASVAFYRRLGLTIDAAPGSEHVAVPLPNDLLLEIDSTNLVSVKATLPNLVVTDVMMPTMGGLEFIDRLRFDPETAAIPILVVSGNSELAAAANTRLRKPFLARELLSAAAVLIREDGG